MQELEVIYNKHTNELITITQGVPKIAYESLQAIRHLYNNAFIIIVKQLQKVIDDREYAIYTERYFNHKSQVSYMNSEDIFNLIGESNDKSN